jgi:hypothetical protein
MGNPIQLQGVDQRLSHMRLPNNFSEGLGAPFSIQGLRGHSTKTLSLLP